MLQWVKNKLGISALEKQQGRASKAINRIEKKIRLGRKPQRYDEIERERARRGK